MVANASLAGISVSEIDLGREDRQAWDQDAHRAGGSMRSAHAHLTGLRWKHLFRGRPRTYEVRMSDGHTSQRIGFATITRTKSGRQFYDGLMLFPEFQDRWSLAFETLLKVLPGGHYDYGWQWNIERSRTQEIAGIRGAEVLNFSDIVIQGIDFSRWPSWDAYRRDVSENVHRNIKKMQAGPTKTEFVFAEHFASLPWLVPLLAMRRNLCARKNIPYNIVRVGLGYLACTLTCPSQSIVALARQNGRIVSMQNQTRFGDISYFLDGASLEESRGAAWYLQMATIKQAYDRTPQGKYLVGYGGTAPYTAAEAGLMRSRNALRVSGWPSSLIRFKWDGANLARL